MSSRSGLRAFSHRFGAAAVTAAVVVAVPVVHRPAAADPPGLVAAAAVPAVTVPTTTTTTSTTSTTTTSTTTSTTSTTSTSTTSTTTTTPTTLPAATTTVPAATTTVPAATTTVPAATTTVPEVTTTVPEVTTTTLPEVTTTLPAVPPSPATVPLTTSATTTVPPTTPTTTTVPPTTTTTTVPATTTTTLPPPTAPPITAPPTPSWRLLPQWQPGSPESRGLDGSGSVPEIMFPVLGPVAFGDGWALPRGNHGERPHEGTDITGVSGQPLRAAFDGVITRHQVESRGIAGVVVTVTRADGLRANYFHLNDDTPGTTDDSAPAAWRIPVAIQHLTIVRAGQIIGFLGDTGNAGIPHLHFELRRPDGTPINPYQALVAAEQREGCFGAFGPWANVGWTEAAGFADAPGDPFAGAVSVHGPGGARWILSSSGEVAIASAMSIVIGRNACGG